MFDRIWKHTEYGILAKEGTGNFLSMMWIISLLSFMVDSGPKGKHLVQLLEISKGIQILSFFFNNHLKRMKG